jgi:hypothetical protein
LQPKPAAQFGIHAVQDNSIPLPHNALAGLKVFLPASNTVEEKFQQNCISGGCLLSAIGRSQPYYYHSTGCATCHYLYNDDGLNRGNDPAIPRDQPGHGTVHEITTAITYSQCDHCHNRGDNSLKRMTFVPREDLPPVGAPIRDAMPPEGRGLKEYYQPIAQFTKCEVELNCVDCHTAQEVMSNGHIYGTKKGFAVLPMPDLSRHADDQGRSPRSLTRTNWRCGKCG